VATTAFITAPDPAQLDIAKTYAPNLPTLSLGQAVRYTVTITNASSSSAGRGTVDDPTPAGITGASWSAAPTSGSTVNPPSAVGAISAVAVVVQPQGRVTFTVDATIDPAFVGDFDITNVATFRPGINTTCTPTDVGESCNANAVFHVATVAGEVTALVPMPPELAATGSDPRLQLRLVLVLLSAGLILVRVRRRPAG
jgi:uncharacterized repeat protein (TIGR01451 family)